MGSGKVIIRLPPSLLLQAPSPTLHFYLLTIFLTSISLLSDFPLYNFHRHHLILKQSMQKDAILTSISVVYFCNKLEQTFQKANLFSLKLMELHEILFSGVVTYICCTSMEENIDFRIGVVCPQVSYVYRISYPSSYLKNH